MENFKQILFTRSKKFLTLKYCKEEENIHHYPGNVRICCYFNNMMEKYYYKTSNFLTARLFG
jgi:hypothetical protein